MSPSVVATLALVLLVLAVYWLPSIVASVRQHPDLVGVVVVNALLGWTVFGWLVALRRAVRATDGDRTPSRHARPAATIAQGSPATARSAADARKFEPRMGVTHN